MKKRIKKSEFDLNSLPLLPEMIKEIRSFLPKSWILYKKGKYNLKKGDAVRVEKIDYGILKSRCEYCVPPTIDCVGKILHVYENFCEIRFLKRRDRKLLINGEYYYILSKCHYILSKKHIKTANFSNKKKVIFNKKNIITET